jgi:hypothetical protein
MGTKADADPWTPPQFDAPIILEVSPIPSTGGPTQAVVFTLHTCTFSAGITREAVPCTTDYGTTIAGTHKLEFTGDTPAPSEEHSGAIVFNPATDDYYGHIVMESDKFPYLVSAESVIDDIRHKTGNDGVTAEARMDDLTTFLQIGNDKAASMMASAQEAIRFLRNRFTDDAEYGEEFRKAGEAFAAQARAMAVLMFRVMLIGYRLRGVTLAHRI